MLRYTGVRLELVTDPDMFIFLEKGIRGGISMISHQHAQANNPYLEETYDEEQPSSYIAYWDANNLYGWSMSRPLPHSNFRWVDDETVANFNVDRAVDEVNTGYILEVDLDYPADLHELHNDYPMAPEQTSIPKEVISPFARNLGVAIYGCETNIPTSKKLVPHLGPRSRYVIHIQNLKQCLTHGLKLTRIHRVLAFHQSAWLEPYIRLNTEKRKVATDEFEKDFFKLMNNSVFGKSCENLRNRKEVELVFRGERLVKLAARPSFKRMKIFSTSLVGVEYAKKCILMDKPLYTGFATLELSKLLMYSFHYDVIKKQYGTGATLLFTDTDSLCYLIHTQDLYKDMQAMSHLFDTSNYSKNHPLFDVANAKVLGKMKDELGGVPGKEFVGLRPKMYCLMSGDNLEKKTAKGVSKTIIRKELKFQKYLEVLREGSRTFATMFQIRARAHKLQTQKVTKVALSAYDDKRYILPDGVTTLAHGHYKTGIPFPRR
jgi:hypothetical protein